MLSITKRKSSEKSIQLPPVLTRTFSSTYKHIRKAAGTHYILIHITGNFLPQNSVRNTKNVKESSIYFILNMAAGVKAPHLMAWCSSEFASSWEDFYTRLLRYFFSLSLNGLFLTTVLLQQPADKFNGDLNNPNNNNKKNAASPSFRQKIFARHYQKYTSKFLAGKLIFS